LPSFFTINLFGAAHCQNSRLHLASTRSIGTPVSVHHTVAISALRISTTYRSQTISSCTDLPVPGRARYLGSPVVFEIAAMKRADGFVAIHQDIEAVQVALT
jgi:hypothetical protein